MGKDKKKKKDKEKRRREYDLGTMLANNMKHTTEVSVKDFIIENNAIFGANVNLKRHIQEIKDNLKPVSRRILMSLHDLRLYDRYGKSSQISSKVTEVYHPHSNDAIYESLVNLAQPFRNNIVLVDGHGNFGSAYNPKAYAAMRYTDARMSDFTKDCFFSDWRPRDVFTDASTDYVPTYTDEYLEPLYLISKYPLFLLNWHAAMGVGKSTATPGFNLREAFEAVMKLIDNPEAKIVMYPDDPQGCMIVNKNEIKDIMDSDNVKIKLRATYEVEVIRNSTYIIIDSVPFEVNPSKVVDSIAELHRKGAFPEISNVGGESINKGMGFEISIEVKKGYDPEAVMQKLYKKTALEKTFSTKYAFVDELESKEYTLRIAILEWLRYRRNSIKRLKKIRLAEISRRIHVLDAIIDMNDSDYTDKVIDIIRHNKKKDARQMIMDKFGYSDYQVANIVSMELSKLSPESYDDYVSEKKDLLKEYDKIEAVVMDNSKVDEIIKKDFQDAIIRYGTERKSSVVQMIDGRKEAPDTDHYLIFTNKYIKKLPYNPGGYKIGKIEDGDKIRKILVVNNRERLAIFDKSGRVSLMAIDNIGNSVPQSLGIALSTLGITDIFADAITIQDDFHGIISSVTKNGLVTNTSYDELVELNDKSYNFMKVGKDDELVKVTCSESEDRLLVYTISGKGLLFRVTDLETTGKGTKGVIAIKLEDGDYVSGITTVHKDDRRLLISTNRAYMKHFSIKKLPKMNRNEPGIELSTGNGDLVAVIAFSTERENMYGYTNVGAFEFDPSNIKSTDRIGRNERVLELNQSTYLFDLF